MVLNSLRASSDSKSSCSGVAGIQIARPIFLGRPWGRCIHNSLMTLGSLVKHKKEKS